MCHQPPGTDVCNTFKSSLMRGRFTTRGTKGVGRCEAGGERGEKEEKETVGRNKGKNIMIISSFYVFQSTRKII